MPTPLWRRIGRRTSAALLGAALLALGLWLVLPGAPVVSVTLDASPQTLQLGGVTVPGMTYNGNYAGPEIRVHPGDRLRIKLLNHLAEPTNLHFHGIETSPQANGDNVAISVAPGDSFDYDIEIPATQPPGLYWYHAHLHGLAERQVRAGLSGPLVVEGLADRFAGLSGIGEDIFVLKDIEFDDSDDPVVENELNERLQTINGATQIEQRLRPGETRLWRFSNQSPNLYFHLGIEGYRFRVLAEDGVTVERPRDVTRLDIKPASRLEVLVTGGAEGQNEIVSYGVPTGSGSALKPNRVLGHLTVAGEPASPTVLPVAAADVPDLSARPVDAFRAFTFSQAADGEHFFLNGRLYDHERTDLRVPLGHVEEWTIRNESDDLHVFHIHQVSFQVVEVNGEKQTFDGQVDVARVPERGSIKIRLAFTDPRILGRFVYHCHVLKHEDKGMMANIEVYDPAESAAWHRLRLLYQKARLAMLGLPTEICGL